MKDVILYGAFDRHNYGDLLFPIIMKRLIENSDTNINVMVSGMVESDLLDYGALKTESIKDCLNKSGSDAVIILAGGDVISCDWFSAISYLIPDKLEYFFERVIFRFFSKPLLNVAKKYVGVHSYFPFQPDKRELIGSRSVIYNSVGATGVSGVSGDAISELTSTLGMASYISVRDTFSRDSVKDVCDLDVEMSPDSATMMGEVFSVDEVCSRTSKDVNDLITKLDNGFIIFQISNAHARVYGNEFSSAISDLYKKIGLPIVFIAIGNAAGHRDIDGIRRITQELSPEVEYYTYEEGGVFDIMNLIRCASCYCGTSLHGLITSMSFLTPRVGLLPKLRKQVNYMNTWDLPEMPRGVLPAELSDSVVKAMSFKEEELQELNRELTSKYRDTFDKIIKVLG
ncbi:polysaccharide pyruvyl transferase family protein [Motiliproteus sp. MSK22-1]|uniref:polysaccharide pyruvyl transferase family protein n=1 Tax=Motiliproteus sp. MSK22-1 TaxID=1897630 RepID=UPI000976EF5C|nr:polysaccharide pyruvyl transferase family protein [Motiliproteus sp. MSK22-1]OMH39690.1 hypothetical protein BGP75_02320 [Motiliproteus sp. MSK22-1]